jgi:hypothetical protein
MLGVQNEHRNVVHQRAASDLIFTLFNDDVTIDEVIWRRMGWEYERILILQVTVSQF